MATLAIDRITERAVSLAGGNQAPDRSHEAAAISSLERLTQRAADLHWLAYLLTGSREIAVDVTLEAIDSQDDANPVFSSWMVAWSRKIVMAKALATIRGKLAASACRMESEPADRAAVPGPVWSLDRDTTKLDLERALLSIDVFPRAVILLSIFEGMPLPAAAHLLDANSKLVRKAQAIGLRELTAKLSEGFHHLYGHNAESQRSELSTVRLTN